MKSGSAGKALVVGIAALASYAALPVAHASYIDSVDNINTYVGYTYTQPGTNYQLSPPVNAYVTAGMASNFIEYTSGGNLTGQGYGYFSGFGSATQTNYCSTGSSCILTYQFGGITPILDQSGAVTGWNTGYLNIYANSTSNFSVSNFYSTDQYAAAGKGQLYMTLAYNVATYDFTTGGYSAFLTSASYNGAYGDANYLISGINTVPTQTAWSSTSGAAPYTLPYMYLAGSVPTSSPVSLSNVYFSGDKVVGGTANGTYYAVPEPSDLGMMGLGLLMVGMLGLRVRQSRFRRD